MATQKKRVVISLSDRINNTVSVLARRDQVPHATKVVELLTAALEIEEDEVLNRIARDRDENGVKFVSHERAWR